MKDQQITALLVTKMVCARCGTNLNLRYDFPKRADMQLVAVEPCFECDPTPPRRHQASKQAKEENQMTDQQLAAMERALTFFERYMRVNESAQERLDPEGRAILDTLRAVIKQAKEENQND